MATAKRGSVNLALQDLIAAFQPIIKKVGDLRWKIESEAAALDSLEGLCAALADAADGPPDERTATDARVFFALMNAASDRTANLNSLTAQLMMLEKEADELLATAPEWAGIRHVSVDPATGERKTWRPLGPAVEWVKPADLTLIKPGGINAALRTLTKTVKTEMEPKRSHNAKPAARRGKAVRS